MPIKIKNMDAGLGVMFTCQGIITGQEIIHTNSKILSRKENIKISRFCILDYSETTEINISNAELKIIAAQDVKISTYRPDYIIAIVATRDLEFGISRLWEAIVQTHGIRWETWVFRDRSDAEKWVTDKVKDKYGISITLA